MWIPTEHEKYGVGESPRGELLFHPGWSGCAFLVLRPLASLSLLPVGNAESWSREAGPRGHWRAGPGARGAPPAPVPGARGSLCGSLEWRRGGRVSSWKRRRAVVRLFHPLVSPGPWAAAIPPGLERFAGHCGAATATPDEPRATRRRETSTRAGWTSTSSAFSA